MSEGIPFTSSAAGNSNSVPDEQEEEVEVYQA